MKLDIALFTTCVASHAIEPPWVQGDWHGHGNTHSWPHAGQGDRADSFNDTVFALAYGDALVGFAKIAQPLTAIGPNTLFINANLATPDLTTVVSPNVDTIYAAAVLDLSQSDLAITIPEIPNDRYWDFAFYDPFGTNYVNLGVVNEDSAGNYSLKLAPQTRYSGFEDPSIYGVDGHDVTIPVAYSILLIRLLVRNNTTDVDAARALLEQCLITPSTRPAAEGQSIPKLNFSLFDGLNVTTDHPLDILNLTARIAPWNPPFDAYDPSTHTFPFTVTERLRRAGIYDGVYHQPKVVNVTEAQAVALNNIAQAGASHAVSLGNGWVRSDLIGRYGADFATRSYFALSFYLALVDTETIYPNYNGGQPLEIGADDAYIFTFSSRPPVKSDGFWSLTVYGEDHFLVENPIDVYALGDRSNITYADGTRVYGNSANTDAPFQILVQPANFAPPTNWTGNWIPSPAMEGLTYCVLRLYVPTPALTNGSWEYPVVTKLAALAP